MKIHLKPIKNEIEINLIAKIYIDSFPADERREINSLIKELNNNLFHPNIIFWDEKIVGIFFYWDFSKFVYIEHFAIEKKQRGKGIGKKVLIDFIHNTVKPFVLEIEKPLDEHSLKRLHFYESIGFEIIENNYIQPPYGAKKKSVELFLLSFPLVRNSLFISHIISSIYREVYKKSC